MKIIVTGCAGFIGMHTCQKLLSNGYEVFGLDNVNNYYSQSLKRDRLHNLKNNKFSYRQIDISNYKDLEDFFNQVKPNVVIHLAAQAGVRYSITNPHAYFQSNLLGFGNVLEVCREHRISHLIYASSSSVYGANTQIPFSIVDKVDHPLSLYAATKKANELMAHSYSHLYQLPTTGLRFFTVYGPWGRPDMAPWLFTEAIHKGEKINIYNHGHMSRDFTYVDDVVQLIGLLVESPPTGRQKFCFRELLGDSSDAPYAIYNVGNEKPVDLMTFIGCIESSLGIEAIKEYCPMQDGDVEKTFADISEVKKDFNFQPKTLLQDGIERWVKWYLAYTSQDKKIN